MKGAEGNLVTVSNGEADTNRLHKPFENKASSASSLSLNLRFI
jgi:hypothetical protein